MSPRISTEELVEELRTLADEVGGTPTMADMDAEGRFSPSTYQQRFGSWNDAVAAAGLEPDDRGTPVSEAALLSDLRRVTESLGGSPPGASSPSAASTPPRPTTAGSARDRRPSRRPA